MSEQALKELQAARTSAQAQRDLQQVTLFVKDSHLYFRNTEGEDSIVLVVYGAGDCDTFQWPLDLSYRDEATQRENILRAMYDEREMGHIPVSVRDVVLPDGTTLSLDG